MRIAVTGATGFIGRRLVARLVRDGHEVSALVRDDARAAETFGGAVRTALVDLGGGPVPATALRGHDAVIHLAAYLPRSYADATEARACLETNALGTLALALASVEAEVPVLVTTSSGNAYRKAPRLVTEQDALYPASRAAYYLTSKVAGEVLATHARGVVGARTVVLRPSAIYGPGMAGGLVPTLASKLAAREPVRLSDGGAYEVDLVWVDDVVAAAVASLTPAANGAYNVGSGRAVTTLEVAMGLARVLGAADSLIHVDPPRSGAIDSGFSALDVSRARDELGLVATSLEDGLRAYVASR